MDERTLQKHFADLHHYLSRLPGEARSGLTWQDFAARMQAQKDVVLPLLRDVIAPPMLVPPPEGPAELATNYNTWTETRRRKANLDAMRVLAQMKADGRNVPYPEERPYLEAFSGWGGIDVLKLPADPAIFDPDYVEAIEQYQRTAQLRPGDAGWGIPKTNVFAGLANQYFTALSIGEAMWSLVNRAAHVTIRTALEPSAGIGRFAQAAPSNQTVQWSMVEYDPLVVQFLSALYPTAEVVPGRFETFAAEAASHGRLFDAALLNPPYNRSGRPKGDLREDAEFAGWALPQDYFVLRAASLLRPGGVLAFITPIGQLTGKGAENVKLRRWLSEWCHFAGAVVPPSDMFPGVLITPAIQVWVKKAPRPEGATYRPTDEEEAIIRGNWLDTEQARHAIMGTWAPHPRYGSTADPIVVGEFDPEQAGSVALRPLPAPEVAAIQVWNRTHNVPRVSARAPSFRVPEPSFQPPSVSAAMPPPVEVDPGVALLDVAGQGDQELERQAVALAYRIAKFQSLTRQVQGAAIAEAGRLELLLDLQEFVDAWGNPHTLSLQHVSRDVAPLLAAWLPTGGPAPAFATEVSGRSAMEPPANSTLEQVISWYSKHNGVCTYRDLVREIQRGVLPNQTRYEPEALLVYSSVYIDPPYVEGETPTYYRREEYLTGDLAARLDNMTASVEALELSLPEGATTPLLERYRTQMRLLQEAMPSPSVMDIQLSIRGPDVTPTMVQEFVRSYTNWKHEEPPVLATKVDDFWALRVNPEVFLSSNWLTNYRDKIQHLAGYLLRAGESPDVFDPDKVSLTQTYKKDTAGDLEARLTLDRSLESAFLAWVMDNEIIAEELLNKYIRRHAWRGRSYSTEPLPIARMASKFMGNPAHGQTGLNPHQTSAVRRIADRGSGLIAHDVGAGKTFTGAAVAAYLRQLNYARRPIITVPLTVLANWYDEARRLLPDYRIGTLGLSIDMSGPERKVRRDNAAVRTEKWERYRQGGYDLFLVPHTAMFRDVAMRDETLFDEMGRILWMRRGLGKDALEAEVIGRRIEEAEADVAKTQQDLAEARRFEPEKVEMLELRLETRKNTVKRLQQDLEKHHSTAKGIEKIRADLEEMMNEKPFRPNYKPTDWRKSDPVEVLWNYANEEFIPDLEPLETYQRGGRLNKKALVELIELHRPKPEKGQQQSIPLEPLVYWEDLGCDLLIIDEAHNFKNIWHASPRMGQSMLYMGGTSEDDDPQGQIWDMFLKTQYLLRNHNDRGVVLLTATPVKNSPMEIYNMLSFCSTELWPSRGVEHKEQFVDRYIDLEVTAGASVSMDVKEALGANFREATLPELRGILDVYVDRQTTDDLLASGALRKVPQPRLWGTQKHEWIPMDPVQDALYDQILAYIQNKQAEADEAAAEAEDEEDQQKAEEAKRKAAILILLQMDLLLKTALDPRLLPYELVATRESLAKGKLGGDQLENKLAKLEMLESLDLPRVQAYYDGGVIPSKLQVLGQYVSSHQDCGHVVFADNKEMHPWVIDALVAYGIPREAIAVIDSDVPAAQRQVIAKKFTGAPAQVIEGVEVEPAIDPLQYLVVLGTSGAMAEGINLQGKTCAIHHLNLPWEPATLHQRNGRGVRQGNVHDVVDVLHYIAAKSFDGVQLDYVLGKKAWQDSLFDPDSRSLDLSGGMDRMELVVLATVRGDEELAYAKLAEIRAKLAEKMHARQVERAKRKYASLVQVYVRARKAEPAKRDGAFAVADREAEELRQLPDTVFPRKELLDMIRQDVVYYDFDTNFAIPANRYMAFTLNGRTVRVAVYEIKPSNTWWTFKVRMKGSFALLYAASVRGIFVAISNQLRDGYDYVEFMEQLPAVQVDPWTEADFAEDVQQAVASITVYDQLRTLAVGGVSEEGMVATYAQDVHQKFVGQALTGERPYNQAIVYGSLVPLVAPPEYPGGHTRLLLLSHQVATRVNGMHLASAVQDMQLVLPGDWATFVEHAVRGEVYAMDYAGELRLVDEDGLVEQQLRRLCSDWFKRAWPIKSVSRKWATAVRRKRHGENVEDTDENDEDD